MANSGIFSFPLGPLGSPAKSSASGLAPAAGPGVTITADDSFIIVDNFNSYSIGVDHGKTNISGKARPLPKPDNFEVLNKKVQNVSVFLVLNKVTEERKWVKSGSNCWETKLENLTDEMKTKRKEEFFDAETSFIPG